MDLRPFGDNWKIVIPFFVIMNLFSAYILSFIVAYPFWGIFLCLMVVTPLYEMLEKGIRFILTGR